MMSTIFLLKNILKTAICSKTDIENPNTFTTVSRVSCSDVSYAL